MRSYCDGMKLVLVAQKNEMCSDFDYSEYSFALCAIDSRSGIDDIINECAS